MQYSTFKEMTKQLRFSRTENRFKDRKWEEIIPVHNVPTKWNWVVQYPDGLKLGEYVDIGPFTLIQARYGVQIGDNAQIGSHCSIYSHNTIDDTKGDIVIGEFACIGSHTTILPGVKIGCSAIIGAHSLVKTDIPDNAVAYGVPAKIVKEKTK